MQRVLLISLWSFVLIVAGCKEPADSSANQSAIENEPSSPPADAYGRLVGPVDDVTPLSSIAADPARYAGSQVRTEGEIQRVCQKRGCWLELSDASGARAFVPMAGHAFSVPMDSVGRDALVEGTVHQRVPTRAEREHLEADGAGPHIPELSIEANAVVIQH